MQAASDTPTTPNPIGPLPPLPRGEALPVVPTTPAEAAARFSCPKYKGCIMSGAACAGRHTRAEGLKGDTGLRFGMRHCIGCEAGKARVQMLGTDVQADQHDGRRPGIVQRANGESKATRERKAAERRAEYQATERAALPDRAQSVGATTAPDLSSSPPRARKPKGKGKPPPCRKCFKVRHWVKRPEGHPLHPYCNDCVRGAATRLSRRMDKPVRNCPEAVAIVLREGSVAPALKYARSVGIDVRPDRRTRKRRAANPKPPVSAASSAESAATVPSPSPQADQPAQPVGHVTEGGGASCPASSPSAAPSESESSTRAARAFSTPCGQVADECAGDVVDDSVEDCPSLLTGEHGAEPGPGGVSLRRPRKPMQAIPAEPACPASVTTPVADSVRTAADLEPPPARSLRDVDGVSGRGPTWRQVAQGLLDEMRESAAADLVEITRLQIQVKKLEAENRQLVRALALAKGFEVDQ